VAAAVFHLFVGDETVFVGELVELGAGIGVRDADLDGFAIEVLAKLMVLRIDSLVSPGRPRMKSA
jgi:hypothetical protein